MRDLKSLDPNDERDLSREKGGQAGGLEEADAGMAGNDAASYGAKEHEGEETRELTGFDAPARLADAGDAGNGASYEGADMSSLLRRDDQDEEPPNLEASPDMPADLSPDKISAGFSDPRDEDREVTARPSEEIRPITPDLLPEG